MRQLNDFLLNDLIVCFDLFGAVCVCVLFICVYDYYARANGKNATLA